MRPFTQGFTLREFVILVKLQVLVVNLFFTSKIDVPCSEIKKIYTNQ